MQLSNTCLTAFHGQPSFFQHSGASFDLSHWRSQAQECVAIAGVYLLFDAAFQNYAAKPRQLSNASFAQRESWKIGVCAPTECSTQDDVAVAWHYVWNQVLKLRHPAPIAPTRACVHARLSTAEATKTLSLGNECLARKQELLPAIQERKHRSRWSLDGVVYNCPGDDEISKTASRLRAKLAIAARSGFALELLVHAVDDAEALHHRWMEFGLRLNFIAAARGRVPLAADTFARQVYGMPSQLGGSTLGNAVTRRHGVNHGTSLPLHFIDISLSFPSNGSIIAIQFYVARVSEGLRFQIYRQVLGSGGALKTYKMIAETANIACPTPQVAQTYTLPVPLQVEAGDHVGWSQTGNGTLSFDVGGNSVAWWHGATQVGSNIEFVQGGLHTLQRTFSYQVLYTNSTYRHLSPSTESYCLFAHLAASFVLWRTQHLYSACVILKMKCTNDRLSAAWLPRVLRKIATLELPERFRRYLSDEIMQSLLLTGYGRRLDAARLAGWPVGSGELTELLDAVRAACIGETKCTYKALERTLASRFSRVRQLGGVRIALADRSWWNEGWSVPNPTNAMPCRHSPEQGLGRIKLRVVFTGTHGAVFNEIKVSWREAVRDVKICDYESYDFVFAPMWEGSALYQVNAWLKEQAWKPKQHTLQDLLNMLPFQITSHTYVDPYSSSAEIRHQISSKGNADGFVFVCSIPAITCAAFATLPWPVIGYWPAPLTVQVPQENYAAWLRLVMVMMQESKNHFIATNPGTRAQAEHILGVRIPVIPILCLYVNASYSGWDNSKVLVHDRTNTILLNMLRSLTPSKFPMDFVGYLETDRQYITFAAHRAVVYLPGCWPEQLMFYEFYQMGLPIFVQADPGRYLWPASALKLGRENARFAENAHCGSFGSWKGKHQVKFKTKEGIDIFANYTIMCSGLVYVSVAQDRNSPVREIVRVVAMKTMDQFGNTHALRADTATGALASHGGRCVRLVWAMSPFLRILMGPSAKHCWSRNGPVCTSGVVSCSFEGWSEGEYIVPGPSAIRDFADSRVEPANFDRGDFGATYGYLGHFTFSRRRRHPRPATSPFELVTHFGMREWSNTFDLFRYPATRQFVSLASLLHQLVNLNASMASNDMQAFNNARRENALMAWRTTLRSVAQHQ